MTENIKTGDFVVCVDITITGIPLPFLKFNKVYIADDAHLNSRFMRLKGDPSHLYYRLSRFKKITNIDSFYNQILEI